VVILAITCPIGRPALTELVVRVQCAGAGDAFGISATEMSLAAVGWPFYSPKQKRLLAGLQATNACPDRGPGWCLDSSMPCHGLGIVWSRPVRPSPVTSSPGPRSVTAASGVRSAHLCSAQKNGRPALSLCSDYATLKRHSKALKYEYRVKTAALITLKRYSIISLTLYLEWYSAYFIVDSSGLHYLNKGKQML
jgi:hypothetical protein